MPKDKIKQTDVIRFGNQSSFPVEFEKEKGFEMVDTEVKFPGSFWISVDDKTKFMRDLGELINKHFI